MYRCWVDVYSIPISSGMCLNFELSDTISSLNEFFKYDIEGGKCVMSVPVISKDSSGPEDWDKQYMI